MPSQTLSLSQSQQQLMVLAPQLRQSLEMLQLPILELRTMIQQELEQNPTIEEEHVDVPALEAPAKVEEGAAEAENRKEELDFEKEFEVLSKLDQEWRDYFYQDQQSRPYTSEDAEKAQFIMDSIPQRESLQEHLLNQLVLTGLPQADQQLGEMLIGSIDDDGYLATPIAELALSVSTDVHRLEDVLAVIQDFHPTGIGARDLRECLLLQLERMGKADSLPSQIVRDHLDKLGAKKHADIARALKVTVEDVQSATKFIATLDPKPGRLYAADTAAYVFPEVAVQKVDGQYVVQLNDDDLPHVRISNHYRLLMQDAATKPEVRAYIRERIRAGAFLIKSIHQRQKTIHRIATEIVRKQTEFLDRGIAHLRPMTMAEVASVVGVHETTVSRAVSGKYMQTPKGVFDMKYFFTPGIRTAEGTEVSNETVKNMIANMVAAEDDLQPLSDQEIMGKLREKGIPIARRTIAKYRLLLRIPPSHMRKGF